MPNQTVNPWELTTRIVPIGDLKEMDNNARTHNPRSLEAVRQSLVQHGQRKPVVVASDGITVIAGNGTLVSARQEGWTHLAVADSPFEPNSKEANAYALADNRTAELSMFDRDIVAETLKGLDEDLRGVLGWNDDELSVLLPPPSPNAGAAAHFGQLAEPSAASTSPGSDSYPHSEGSPSGEGGAPVVQVNPSAGYATIILTGTSEEIASIRARLNVLKGQWGLDQLGKTVIRLLNEYDVGPGDTGAGE